MNKAMIAAGLVLVFVVVAPFALVAFGARSQPPPMESISAPFKGIDTSDLPPEEFLSARDGTKLAYRHYQANGKRFVLALHGSSADGESLHVLARALAEEGIDVVAPDIRGHGQSGRKGDVDYVGQLEDDITDFLAQIHNRNPTARLYLMGFSSGGGLALRYAGSRPVENIERLVLVSPMLGIDSPSYTDPNPHAAEVNWARPFVPRIIGLSILNALGIHAFDRLPVIAFAIDPGNKRATARYSHRLLKSMNPDDYRALLENVACPITLLAGSRDEVFAAASYEKAVHAVRPEAVVRLIEGIGHVGMTLEPAALRVIAASLTNGND